MQYFDDNTDAVTGRPPGGLIRNAMTGMFWLFTSAGAQSVLNLFITAILARLLTPSDFGLVAAAMVVIGLSEVFQLAGIGPVLVQRRELRAEHIRTGFTFSLLLGIMMIGIIWWLAPPLARFFQMPELVAILRVMAFVFPIHTVSVVSRNLIQRSLKFRKMAGIDVAAYVIGYGGVGLTLAWLGWGVWALVAAHLASATAQALFLYIVQPHRMVPQLDAVALKELLSSAGGFTLAEFLSYTARRVDRLVTGRWLGSEMLGVYSRALSITHVLIRLPARVMGHVLFPSFAKVQHDRERLARVFQHALGVMSLLILPVSVVTLILADEMVSVLLGGQWVDTVWPLRILSVSMLFSMQSRICNIVARSCGDVYRLSVRQAFHAAAMFVGAWGGHFHGVRGVAVGVTLAFALNTLVALQQCVALQVLTWRRWGALTLESLVPSLIIAAWAAFWAWLFRGWGIPPFFTLSLVLGLAVVAFALLLLVGPPRWVGRNGGWFLHYMNTFRAIPYVRDRSRKLKNLAGE